MSKDPKRRRDEARRRFEQRSSRERSQAERAIAAAVEHLASDPEAFARALRHFSTLALTRRELAELRFPHEDLLDGFLDTPPPAAAEVPDEGARRAHVRAALLPRLASPPRLDALGRVLDRARKRLVEDDEDLLAFLAAESLLASCRQEGAGAGHAFWELPFDLTVTDTLLSGELPVALFLRRLEPDREAVAAAFARALAGAAGGDLLALGVTELDPGALAAAHATHAAALDGYHVQLDGALHLVLEHQRFVASPDGDRLVRVGLGPAEEAALLEVFARAYAQDVLEGGLPRELDAWAVSRLEALRDRPDPRVAAEDVAHERERCAALLLGLRALPPADDALLRGVHARSLVLARRRVAEDELPFVIGLSARPDDPFTIEEYERFLSAKGDLARARRARRFLEHVRALRRAAEGNGARPAAGAEPAAGGA